MSSRRPVRQLVVAVLLGVLVGGGLMAVTPAGAEVTQAAATNWKKIWKKKLKPLAVKTFYTKAQSDAKYQPKGAYEAAGSGYSKAESDAKYAGAGSSYTKAESDGRYARTPQVIRGTFGVEFTAAAAGANGADGISFGANLGAEPEVHMIPPAGPVPTGCAGTAAAPSASPGHLCIFIASQSNGTNARAFDGAGFSGSSTFGATTAITSVAAGAVFYYGSWAVAPASLAAPGRTVPSETSGTAEGR